MLRAYLSVSKAAIKINFTYRIKLLLYAIIGIIQAVVYYFLWVSVYSNNNGLINGYTQREMITYLIISFTILSLMPKWITMEIGRMVRDGSVSDKLLKPMSFLSYFFFFGIGDTVVIGLFMGVPLLFTGFYFFDILLPQNLPLFLISVIFSIILVFLISYIVGLLSFWTTKIWGIFVAYEGLLMFLSGGLIPIKMFPKAFQNIVNVLPFKCAFDVPINIYLNKMWGASMLHPIMLQLFWILVLYFLCKVIYNRAIKVVTILGG